MTTSGHRARHGAPGGAGTSQARHPSKRFRMTATASLPQDSQMRRGRTKSAPARLVPSRPVQAACTAPRLRAGPRCRPASCCALVPVAGGAGALCERSPSAGRAELTARSHAAVLELYSLDSQLSRRAPGSHPPARRRPACVHCARTSPLPSRDRAPRARGLEPARSPTALRVLYEQGDADPLAVAPRRAVARRRGHAPRRPGPRGGAGRRGDPPDAAARAGRCCGCAARSRPARAHLDALAGEAEAAVAQLERTRAARSAYVAQLRPRSA